MRINRANPQKPQLERKPLKDAPALFTKRCVMPEFWGLFNLHMFLSELFMTERILSI
jgi:hypothetical protein